MQLGEGRRMLDRSTVSMPSQVLQSGKIEGRNDLCCVCMHGLCLICGDMCMVFNKCLDVCMIFDLYAVALSIWGA